MRVVSYKDIFTLDSLLSDSLRYIGVRLENEPAKYTINYDLSNLEIVIGSRFYRFRILDNGILFCEFEDKCKPASNLYIYRLLLLLNDIFSRIMSKREYSSNTRFIRSVLYLRSPSVRDFREAENIILNSPTFRRIIIYRYGEREFPRYEIAVFLENGNKEFIIGIKDEKIYLARKEKERPTLHT